VTHRVTVVGTGIAAAPPDVLRLDLAAEARGQQVTTAVDRASAALDAMRQALSAGGVAAADVSSSGVSLQPEYTDRARVAGYVARLQLRALVRDLGRGGRLLADAVAAGGDAARVDGMRLEHADSHVLRSRARQGAWEDARTAAEEYARLAGRSLGRVIAVTEASDGAQPRPVFEMATMQRVAAVPVEPGSLGVTVTVQVRWELV
jgi:uncharacterized protein YggE